MSSSSFYLWIGSEFWCIKYAVLFSSFIASVRSGEISQQLARAPSCSLCLDICELECLEFFAALLSEYCSTGAMPWLLGGWSLISVNWPSKYSSYSPAMKPYPSAYCFMSLSIVNSADLFLATVSLLFFGAALLKILGSFVCCESLPEFKNCCIQGC